MRHPQAAQEAQRQIKDAYTLAERLLPHRVKSKEPIGASQSAGVSPLFTSNCLLPSEQKLPKA